MTRKQPKRPAPTAPDGHVARIGSCGGAASEDNAVTTVGLNAGERLGREARHAKPKPKALATSSPIVFVLLSGLIIERTARTYAMRQVVMKG